MEIHSGILFGGLHYSTVSQTFMFTSMEREYRVQSPSPPPSPSEHGCSLLALPKAPAIAAVEYTVFVGVTTTGGNPALSMGGLPTRIPIVASEFL